MAVAVYRFKPWGLQDTYEAESVRQMILRQTGRRAYLLISMLAITVLLALAPRVALAQDDAAAAEATATEAAPGYTPMAPTPGVPT